MRKLIFGDRIKYILKEDPHRRGKTFKVTEVEEEAYGVECVEGSMSFWVKQKELDKEYRLLKFIPPKTYKVPRIWEIIHKGFDGCDGYCFQSKYVRAKSAEEALSIFNSFCDQEKYKNYPYDWRKANLKDVSLHKIETLN